MSTDTRRRQDPPTAAADAIDAQWRRVLEGGSSAPIPRWTSTPGSGTARAELRQTGAAGAVPDLARRLGVSREAVLLAVHAVVVAALTGETEVLVALDGPGGRTPVRADTAAASWSSLVRAVDGDLRRAAGGLERLARLADEARMPLPTVSSSVSVGPWSGARPDDREDPPVLVLEATDGGLAIVHRLDTLDVDAAARIAGYHGTALALAVAAPELAPPVGADLVPAAECELQLHGMSGPVRPLPDLRVHRLVEERVRRHPAAVAAVHAGQHLTYAELNSRANRVARALVARGVGREGVVAVVAHRDLDWMTAVLAVFKAGATYLPLEPHFPSDRIATTLRRSGARHVLTGAGIGDALGAALDVVAETGTRPERLLVGDALGEGHDDDDLDVVVDGDQLAYIYFTSGSTGQPKGAMCEQAGMLNHLLAKIEDLEIGEGDVVAQTAPQCFDISLWQLLSALLVGGRTVLVEQDVVLDVERMVDGLVADEVGVLQVVPSYLEVVMTYLERRPRELPALHVVSVTGEAVKKELVDRWFAVAPSIALVNAYGLTETSDDTNHEVMRRAPEGDRVPLGPPIRNVTVLVVDPDLRPVPLGAPGEIVFSGVCVGRGYVNDPERTALAFVADPREPGARLYRSGDFGRWTARGALEFLGRRDTQLKISGFRIEIGEIENTLLGAPGVRDAAVVVITRPDGSRHLVGFASGDEPVTDDRLRQHLAASLPHYMVPATVHWRERLPLSANGKIDRKALTALASDLAVAAGSARVSAARRAPSTPAELRVASAWARALGTTADRFGLDDHFFDLGGTSLSAVKVVIGLDRAVSLRDVTTRPVLGDLARVLDGTAAAGSGILQPLGQPTGTDARGVLVWLPHAGGNAVNAAPLARALAAVGGPVPALYAAELPGHDLTGAPGELLEVETVAVAICDELIGLGLRPVALWGQSAGAALALAVAGLLQQRGTPAAHVFLGAQLAGTSDARLAAAASLARRADDELVAELAGDTAYPDLGDLDATRAAHLVRAYRHDVSASCRWIAAALDQPLPLLAPVTVVTATDDPSTPDAARRHHEWAPLAPMLTHVELPDGGHHLLRTRPRDVAGLVVTALSDLLV